MGVAYLGAVFVWRGSTPGIFPPFRVFLKQGIVHVNVGIFLITVNSPVL